MGQHGMGQHGMGQHGMGSTTSDRFGSTGGSRWMAVLVAGAFVVAGCSVAEQDAVTQPDRAVEPSSPDGDVEADTRSESGSLGTIRVVDPVAESAAEPGGASMAADGSMSPADLAEAVGGAVWRVDVDECDSPSSGSAFAISESTLLTNWHVVEFDFEPTVTSRDGATLDGRVIGYSIDPDIAVIEVADGELPEWVEFVGPDELREGDPIVSIGYPVPYVTFTVSPGWVTSFVEEDGQRIGIVSDESSDYGSSGGPLFDLRGRVVGVVTEFTPAEGLQPNGVSYTTVALGEVIAEILDDPQDLETSCAGSAYGTDADLDALWDACAEGRYWACDQLYELSSAGTDYELFGARCGEADVDTDEYCADLFGTVVPFEFGDDPLLDAAWEACAAGDSEACDRLYLIAPLDTQYWEFGGSCGGRFVGTEEYCVDLM